MKVRIGWKPYDDKMQFSYFMLLTNEKSISRFVIWKSVLSHVLFEFIYEHKEWRESWLMKKLTYIFWNCENRKFVSLRGLMILFTLNSSPSDIYWWSARTPTRPSPSQTHTPIPIPGSNRIKGEVLLTFPIRLILRSNIANWYCLTWKFLLQYTSSSFN